MRRLAGIVKQAAAQDQNQEAARRARTAGRNESARIYR